MSVSSKPFAAMTPAAFTSISIGPSSDSIEFTVSASEFLFVTSQTKVLMFSVFFLRDAILRSLYIISPNCFVEAILNSFFEILNIFFSSS